MPPAFTRSDIIGDQPQGIDVPEVDTATVFRRSRVAGPTERAANPVPVITALALASWLLFAVLFRALFQ